jgi:large subunit ribosomal protein L14e
MASIEVGRVCVKIAGREAGEKCAIVEIIDENFVEVVGEAKPKTRRQI